MPADTAASRNATTSVTIAPVTRSSMRIAPCGSCEVSTAVIDGSDRERPGDEPGEPEPADHPPCRPRVVEQPARGEQPGGRRRATQLHLADEPEHPRPDRVQRREADRQRPDERADGRRTERAGRGTDHHEQRRSRRRRPPAAARSCPCGVSRRATPSGDTLTRRSETAPDSAASSGTATSATASPCHPTHSSATVNVVPWNGSSAHSGQQRGVEQDAEDRADEPLPGGLGDGQADHLARASRRAAAGWPAGRRDGRPRAGRRRRPA